MVDFIDMVFELNCDFVLWCLIECLSCDCMKY